MYFNITSTSRLRALNYSLYSRFVTEVRHMKQARTIKFSVFLELAVVLLLLLLTVLVIAVLTAAS